MKAAREADLVLVEHMMSCVSVIDEFLGGDANQYLVRELPVLRLSLERMKIALGG